MKTKAMNSKLMTNTGTGPLKNKIYLKLQVFLKGVENIIFVGEKRFLTTDNFIVKFEVLLLQITILMVKYEKVRV